jgi:predicted transcriptional regulator
VTDGFEYLMKFNSDVVNKIRSEYEAIPTYTKEQKLAKDSVLALLNQDITGLEKNLDNLQDVVDTVKKEGKLEIVKSVDPESIKIVEVSGAKKQPEQSLKRQFKSHMLNKLTMSAFKALYLTLLKIKLSQLYQALS